MRRAWIWIALTVFGGVGMAWLLPQMISLRVYAQAPAESRKSGQPTPQQSGQSQQSGQIVLVPKGNPPPLTPLEIAQLQIGVLQDEVKALKEQVKTLQSEAAATQASQQALQNALQTLGGQFAHHSHTFTQTVPGTECGYADNFNLTSSTSGRQATVVLFVKEGCPGHPEWYGRRPDKTVTNYVSPPVQAQPPPW